MRRAAIAAMALTFAVPASASAADPGLWIKTSQVQKPAWYRQGLASNPATGDVFFSGSFAGIYRTRNEREVARNTSPIPPDVVQREQYNHIGDIAFDQGEGGRVLLPLESYAPLARDTNPSKTASIGVMDAKTLAWKYYVKLDPSEIDKCQWVALDAEHGLVWTIGDVSLLAYRLSDITAANAAPNAAPIHSVINLKGVVPEGAGGGLVLGNRIYLSQLVNNVDRVISMDLGTGATQSEIEIPGDLEQEGLDFGAYIDGFLHWELVPGAGLSNTQLLNFVPRGAHLRLKMKHRLKAKKRITVSVRAEVTGDGLSVPLRGVRVRLGGRSAKTNASGRASLEVKLRRGSHKAQASYKGLGTASTRIRAT
jgi:hypothetical protein